MNKKIEAAGLHCESSRSSTTYEITQCGYRCHPVIETSHLACASNYVFGQSSPSSSASIERRDRHRYMSSRTPYHHYQLKTCSPEKILCQLFQSRNFQIGKVVPTFYGFSYAANHVLMRERKLGWKFLRQQQEFIFQLILVQSSDLIAIGYKSVEKKLPALWYWDSLRKLEGAKHTTLIEY